MDSGVNGYEVAKYYVYAYALPFAITLFENMEATYTEAICYV